MIDSMGRATWRLAAGCLLAGLCLANLAHADEAAVLAGLINDYRENAESCNGLRHLAVGPLAPDQRLARARVSSSEQLQQALGEAGYQAAAVQVVSVTGPGTAQQAMAELQQNHCRHLLDAQFAELGVLHSGTTWQVILGRALLPASLGDWQAEGQAILEAVNQARAAARRCGSQAFDAAPALTWNDHLAQAALAHSRDMAAHSRFSHQGRDGSLAGTRATAAGYAWQLVGENIAAGQGSARQVVAGWLASPSHCYNIMNPDFSQMGAAYASNPQSEAAIYWTQVFGTPTP